MLSTIKYVYDKNKDEKEVLLGAKICFFDGEKTSVKEIYVGLPFCLEDILENDINANLLGVIDKKEKFKREYELVNAKGVIYFPQTEEYHFLEETDTVLLWNGDDRIKDTLETEIDKYRNMIIAESVKSKLAAKKDFINNLEPANPLIELFGDSLVRARVSER